MAAIMVNTFGNEGKGEHKKEENDKAPSSPTHTHPLTFLFRSIPFETFYTPIKAASRMQL